MAASAKSGGDGTGVRRPADGSRSGPRRESTSQRLEAAQQAIGQFIRSAREAHNLTQEQVSHLTRKSAWQLSRAAISAIERGQNFPGMEAMLALSNVLYIDPKELVERARFATVVPIDVTGMTHDELERQAKEYFWAGEFRKALAVYDAQREKLVLERDPDRAAAMLRLAALEVRRATALRRAGALLSAMATAERAVALAAPFPEIQARAYVVLATLQAQRGNPPLARDAADRAIELAERSGDERTLGWAWNVRGKVHYMAGAFEDARRAYERARLLAETSGDLMHLTHNEGNLGLCWRELGHPDQARTCLEQACRRANTQGQPALEANWMLELGRIAFEQERWDEADGLAEAALRLARPREQHLTVFRGEWLRHRVALRRRPDEPDRHRLQLLRKLYVHLDQFEGIEEVLEFKSTALRDMAAEERKKR